MIFIGTAQAIWLWERNPVRTYLGVTTLMLVFGLTFSLWRWRNNQNQFQPFNLHNVVWPALTLGVCLWLGLALYERQVPVPTPRDQGELLRRAAVHRLEMELTRQPLFKKVAKADLPVGFSLEASARYWEQEKSEARKVVAEALRVGRRDRQVLKLVLEFVQKRNLPEEEPRIRKLLKSALSERQ